MSNLTWNAFSNYQFSPVLKIVTVVVVVVSIVISRPLAIPRGLS